MDSASYLLVRERSFFTNCFDFFSVTNFDDETASARIFSSAVSNCLDAK